MAKKGSLERISRKIKNCKKCCLYRSANKAVPGEGPFNAKLMLIGVAPGRMENLTGRPFVGRAGQFLDHLLTKNKIDRKKIFITSIIKHFPPKNRAPKSNEIKACLPYTIEQIKAINPKLVVLLGNIAKTALTKNPVLKGRKVIVTYHPASGMRFPKSKAKMVRDFKKLKQEITKHKIY